MAYFRKTESGKGWRAEVSKNNIKKSSTFDTKAEAREWAAETELSIKNLKFGRIPAEKTFGDLIERYIESHTSLKVSKRQETYRLNRLKRFPIFLVLLQNLNETHVAEWRDERLKEVSPGSVIREWNTLSNACNIAKKEWKWLKENPFSDVKKPTAPPPRDRRISDDEIEKILYITGYRKDGELKTKTAMVGVVFLFAIETAMRAGEILRLRWEDIDFDRRFLKVRKGKTDTARRDVPLSTEAIRLLRQAKNDGEKPFDMTSGSFEALFRKCKKKSLIDDLHFHDTRHEAITRLAQKVDVLDLARMVGHKNLAMLMVYYNKSAADIAKKL